MGPAAVVAAHVRRILANLAECIVSSGTSLKANVTTLNCLWLSCALQPNDHCLCDMMPLPYCTHIRMSQSKLGISQLAQAFSIS